jgi:hypothetical protein
MVAMAFPSRSRLTLSELRQALAFIEDAGVVSYPLTHADLEVFYLEVPLFDRRASEAPCMIQPAPEDVLLAPLSSPQALERSRSSPWLYVAGRDVVHLDKRCRVLSRMKVTHPSLLLSSRTVRSELLTSDVLDLCEECASEPLGRRLHHTMMILLLASNVASLTRRIEQVLDNNTLSSDIASLYSVTSTLKKDLALHTESPSVLHDLDGVLNRAATAVFEARDRLAMSLMGRAAHTGFWGSQVVLAYFEHDYVSPWKQDPLESLVRFAYDDPGFTAQVLQRTSPHTVHNSRGLMILPHAVAELWAHAGYSISVLSSEPESRLREVLPLTWALISQGGSLADPALAFAAASALLDDGGPA